MTALRLLIATFVVATTAIIASACVDDTDAKKGGVDEVCFTDTDCAADLVCEARVCTPLEEVGNNGTNNGTNNGNNGTNNGNNGTNNGNNGTNNGTELIGCGPICDHLIDCFPDDFVGTRAECMEGCRDEFPNRRERDEFGRCVLRIDCNDSFEEDILACLDE